MTLGNSNRFYVDKICTENNNKNKLIICNVFTVTRCQNLTGTEFDLVVICTDVQHVSLRATLSFIFRL